MICRKCGELIDDNAKFCPVCGAAQTEPQSQNRAVVNPTHTHSENCTADGHAAASAPMGFGEAVKLFFKNYVNFSGRSRRSEYWYAYLFLCILSFAVGLVAPDLSGILSLLIWLPSLSLSFRRLHDIGKSGWWGLISLIPLAGPILLLIWTCRDSQPGENQWGPSPKY